MTESLDPKVIKYHRAIQLMEACGSYVMADFYRSLLYSYLKARGV